MGLVITIIIIVIIVVIVKNRTKEQPESEEERAAREADEKETIKRFEEAAKNGTDPRSVVGFKAIEEVDEFSNLYIYPKIKQICIELVKADYSLYCSRYKQHKGYRATIGVTGIKGSGDIVLYTNGCWASPNYYSILGTDNARYKKMTIMDDSIGLVISSLSETKPGHFPEWLKICAKILKNDISDPPWLDNPERPWLKKYINSVLKI